jgi:protein-tyrosine phosphatase
MVSFFRKTKSVNDIAWLGVDMHAHLLPGIDDGAADVAQSVRLVRELSELGFSQFICTPHIFTELYPNTPETISDALMVVKTALTIAEINVGIDAAAEYMVDETFKITEHLLCLPGRHILVEMSYLTEMPNIDRLIFELQIKGYNVILAHPERYHFYHKKSDRYHRLKDMGVLFQLNLLSLTGYYGKEVRLAAEHLLKERSYDFAGTDLHHEKHLNELKIVITNGSLYKMIGHYPFKNKDLF